MPLHDVHTTTYPGYEPPPQGSPDEPRFMGWQDSTSAAVAIDRRRRGRLPIGERIHRDPTCAEDAPVVAAEARILRHLPGLKRAGIFVVAAVVLAALWDTPSGDMTGGPIPGGAA